MSANSIVGVPNPQALARRYADTAYELTRRRYASQFGAEKQNLLSQFAGRGGFLSSAARSAERGLRAEQLRALGETSLASQLQGQRAGLEEAGFLEGARQFNQGLDWQKTSFAEQQRFQAAEAEKERQFRAAQAAIERAEAAKARKGGLFGKILGGVGGILGSAVLGPVGGMLGGKLAGLFGGGGYQGPTSGYAPGVMAPNYSMGPYSMPNTGGYYGPSPYPMQYPPPNYWQYFQPGR